MSDLISRQDAINAVKFGITYAKAINKSTGEVKELFKEGNKALNEAAERLKELPSAQPEIIRCKDCRFYEFKQGSLPWNNSRRYCNRSVSLSTQENDYCSYAELRGDSDE